MASAWVARARRALAMTAVVATFLVLAGATYQGVATALERREFPHPGRRVDVGGHQLHLHCIGQGSPTVVLEAPAFGMSAAWGRVQPELGKLTRTCSYDRAGLGWSEAGEAPFDPDTVPDQLHTLLKGSNERGPLILVGQGLGVVFVRLFASKFPYDSGALVLIENPSSGSLYLHDASRWVVAVSPWLARAGVLRAARVLSKSADGLPGEAGGAMRAFLNRPDHLTRAVAEVSGSNAVLERQLSEKIENSLPVTNVPDTSLHGMTRLADADQAGQVTRAIQDSVRHVRGLR